MNTEETNFGDFRISHIEGGKLFNFGESGFLNVTRVSAYLISKKNIMVQEAKIKNYLAKLFFPYHCFALYTPHFLG